MKQRLGLQSKARRNLSGRYAKEGQRVIEHIEIDGLYLEAATVALCDMKLSLHATTKGRSGLLHPWYCRFRALPFLRRICEHLL